MNTPNQDTREERINLAIADYLELVRITGTPDTEHFIAAHADIAAELRAFLDDRQKFKQLVAAVEQAGSLCGQEASSCAARKQAGSLLCGEKWCREPIR